MSKWRALIVCVVSLLSLSAAAQVSQTFCISGNSTGAGWVFALQAQAGYQVLNVRGVAEGSGPEALAEAWARRINEIYKGRPYSATQKGDCFTITAEFDFVLFVGPPGDECKVTNNPQGCSFNPLVIHRVRKTS